MPGRNKAAGVQRMNVQALQLERQILNSIDAKHHKTTEWSFLQPVAMHNLLNLAAFHFTEG